MSTLRSVKEMSKQHPTFSESSLRWIVYRCAEVKNPKNTSIEPDPKYTKFAAAIHRVGRSVKIDEDLFIAIVKNEAES